MDSIFSVTEEWIEYANNDIRTSEYLFNNMHPIPLEIILFHCQQCVEKALKAFLVVHDNNPPKTHNLNELILICVVFTIPYLSNIHLNAIKFQRMLFKLDILTN